MMDCQLFIKSSFVIFALFTFLDVIEGKPYASRDPDEGERLGNSTSTTFSQSEASSSGNVRTKRGAVLQLSELCPPSSRTMNQSNLNNGCEKYWYKCKNIREVKCWKVSFGCGSRINRFGYSKCAPVQDEVAVYHEGVRIRVNRTRTCTCAN